MSAGAALRLAAAQADQPPSELPNFKPAGAAVSNHDVDEEGQEWKFVTRLTAYVSYDDNIFIQPTNEQDDILFHIAPSFGYGIGSFRGEFAPLSSTPHFLAWTGEEDLPRKDFFFVGYTPEGILFSRHSGENSLNHDVRLAARQEQYPWTLFGELHFQSIADTNIDLGQRVRQTYYTANAGAEYALTGKLTGGLRLDGFRQDYAEGFSSTDMRATTYVDYQVAPKTALGLGVAYGYLDVEGGANQTYVQPLLRINYQPTEKVTFTGQAGEEFRQYDSQVPDRSQFVFAWDGKYQATDSTAFNVSGRRETQGSALYPGEDIVRTLYQGGLRQRFLQRIYLSLNGGFVRNDYESNHTVTTVVRRDDFTFTRIALAGDVTQRGSLELSYEHRKNDSSLPNFAFDENVVSLGASFLF